MFVLLGAAHTGNGGSTMLLELQVHDHQGRPIDPSGLGVEGLVALLRAEPGGARDALAGPLEVLDQAKTLMAQVAAVQAAAVCALGRDDAGGPMTDHVEDELSAALVISRRSAQWLRAGAETLRCHPRVWAALAAGHLDATRARILGEALFDVPRTDPEGVPRRAHGAEYALVLDRGLAYAVDHTARQLEIFLRRLLAHLGVDVLPQRRKKAMDRRGVWVSHGSDGTAELTAVLASEDAERVHAAIRGRARADCDRAADGDRRALGPWMADALVDLVLGRRSQGEAGAGGDPKAMSPGPEGGPVPGGPAPGVSTEIHVTIPIDSLAGLSDTPAVVNGLGVIPADVARRLAAGDARWRHVLVSSSSGAVLDVGSRSYRPPAALERQVRLRDGTCRFPGCLVAAAECDLDHLVPFPEGATSAGNLHALCRRHHRLKHEAGWSVDAMPDSGLRWTSPQGAVALTRPEPRYLAAS